MVGSDSILFTDIAFTGTQEGMTQKQRHELLWWLKRLRAQEPVAGGPRYMPIFHHGLCIGADAEAHMTAKLAGLFLYGHPCVEEGHPKRAVLDLEEFSRLDPVQPPLERNHIMVDNCGLLIAAPRQREEVLRSGTWSTVRYARKRGKQTLMLWP